MFLHLYWLMLLKNTILGRKIRKIRIPYKARATSFLLKDRWRHIKISHIAKIWSYFRKLLKYYVLKFRINKCFPLFKSTGFFKIFQTSDQKQFMRASRSTPNLKKDEKSSSRGRVNFTNRQRTHSVTSLPWRNPTLPVTSLPGPPVPPR